MGYFLNPYITSYQDRKQTSKIYEAVIKKIRVRALFIEAY